MVCFIGVLFLVVVLTTGTSFAQAAAVNLFGTSTPAVVDGGDPKSIVLGVNVSSDVPGQVLGCSFYKAATNTGVHVVSLWSSAGKILATQAPTTETASGKQVILFSSPVPIAANQTFTCGYYASNGHYSYDNSAFAAQKNVPPLHGLANGGVFAYGTQPTAMPVSSWLASSYGVDVLFLPSASTGSATWISGANVSLTSSGATVTWNTSVPSDSQVEYGPTTSYGNTTALAAAQVTSHAITISALVPGTAYHFRVRSSDSDAVLAVGLDHMFALAAPVSISASPATAIVVSATTQQFTAIVSNTSNTAVTWSATAGTVSSSGLFTAPTVSSVTQVNVTATSQADSSKSAIMALTVNPLPAVLTVNPASLSFNGQAGTANLTPASVSITNAGAGTLTFTGVSDQPWLMLSAGSGTAPSTLQVSPSITGLKAGTYTGHISLSGGGSTKSVSVVVTLTAPPVQHSVALIWKASTSTKVVSYCMYRSTIQGSSYGLQASALGTPSYTDQTVQSGTTYYYVVTAVDDLGRESIYSNESRVLIP